MNPTRPGWNGSSKRDYSKIPGRAAALKPRCDEIEFAFCYTLEMQSKAKTVAAYLAELPPDRREAVAAVRRVILANLDRDYEEGMSYGMIGYYVPHRIYPPGYHCNPDLGLPFASLASQKNYMAVYLMGVTGDNENWFRAAWAKTGKKLDMGKCCVRFKKLDDLALDLIGEAIRRMPAKKYIDYYESAMRSNEARRAATKASTASSGAGRKVAKKKTAKRAAARTAKRRQAREL